VVAVPRVSHSMTLCQSPSGQIGSSLCTAASEVRARAGASSPCYDGRALVRASSELFRQPLCGPLN
jgi:hypothetical protein